MVSGQELEKGKGGGAGAGAGGPAAPALLLGLNPSPSYSMRTASTAGTLPVARRSGGQGERRRVAIPSLSSGGSRGGAKAMSFSVQAPSGVSDSSSDDESSDEEGEVESRPPTATISSPAVVPAPSTSSSKTPLPPQPPPPPRRRPLRGLRQLPPALAALADLALFRRRRARDAATEDIARLDAALLTVDADEAEAASSAVASAARQRAQEAAEAAAKAEREAAAADAAVSRRLHAASTAAGARADAAAAKARAVAAAETAERAEAEAARRRRAEEEQAAARRRRAAQEEKERQEAEEEERRKREREREQQRAREGEEAKKATDAAAAAETEKARAGALAAAAEAKASAALLPRPAVVASASAAAWAARAAASLAAARAAAAPFVADASAAARARRRAADRAITLAVQQISATSSQVDAKARQLSQLLGAPGPGEAGERAYGFLAFAARVVAQCECQVALSPAFAFPLAQVVAAVCSSVDGGGEGSGLLLEVVSGRLHAASPLAVPSWVRGGAEGHHAKLGYRESNDGKGGLESTDDFAARLRGYALFLGALVAAADAGRWRGGQQAAVARARGWAFAASALNALPANRLVAVVLDGFLDAGGHALYRAYGRQFLKLLAALDEFFLPGLESRKRDGGGANAAAGAAADAAAADAARPAAARLRSYLHGGAFRDPPEGSVLPESDASSYDRA